MCIEEKLLPVQFIKIHLLLFFYELSVNQIQV